MWLSETCSRCKNPCWSQFFCRVEQRNPQHYCHRPEHVQPVFKRFVLIILEVIGFLIWTIPTILRAPPALRFHIYLLSKIKVIFFWNATCTKWWTPPAFFLLILLLQICGIKPQNKGAKSPNLYFIINYGLVHWRALVLCLWNTVKTLQCMTGFELDCRPSAFLTNHNVAVVAKIH